MMKLILIVFLTGFIHLSLVAQTDLGQLFSEPAEAGREPVTAIFKSPWLINSQSIETVHKHDLMFTVMHRFGDLAGRNGGTETFFGLDNSTDILIGFTYGLTDRFNVGLGRAKGAPNGVNTDHSQLFYVNTKYRLLQQTTDGHTPFSLAFFGNSAISAMKKRPVVTSDAAFDGAGDRLSFVAQLIIARKFSENLSVAISPTYIRRNYVSYMDVNNLFALGIGGRLKVSKRMAVVVDYAISFRKEDSKDYFRAGKDFRFYNPLGVGLEIETGGHIFNMSFTNTTATLENQFMPSTSSSWTKGQFRWGFTITRTFSLAGNESEQVGEKLFRNR